MHENVVKDRFLSQAEPLDSNSERESTVYTYNIEEKSEMDVTFITRVLVQTSWSVWVQLLVKIQRLLQRLYNIPVPLFITRYESNDTTWVGGASIAYHFFTRLGGSDSPSRHVRNSFCPHLTLREGVRPTAISSTSSHILIPLRPSLRLFD